MKLPASSYGHYEGQELVTKHVDSVLMLSGIDPNNDMQGAIDSLLLDPEGYNAILGYGKPRHSSNSSFMIASVEKKMKILRWESVYQAEKIRRSSCNLLRLLCLIARTIYFFKRCSSIF